MEQSSGGQVLPEASPLPPKKKRGRPRKSDSAQTTPVSSEKVRKNKESKKNIAAGGRTTPNASTEAFKNDVYSNQNDDDTLRAPPSKPLVGHEVHGVVDGLFDSGYLITIRVNNTDIVFRGVLFGPGLPVDGEDANNGVSETKKRKKRAVEITEEEEEEEAEEEEEEEAEGEEHDEDHAGSVLGNDEGAYYHSAPHSYSDIAGFEQKEVPSVSASVQTMHSSNTEAPPAPPAAYRSSFIDPEMMKFMYPGGLPEQMQYPSNFYQFHPAGTTAEMGVQQPTSVPMNNNMLPPPH